MNDRDAASAESSPGGSPLAAERRQHRGLGRGLDALIPSSGDAALSETQLRAPIGAISPNQSQPRQEFDRIQLQELAASIREHGILQPLLVRRNQAAGFELIAGERRWRAAGLAGLETVPIVIQEDTRADEASLTLALVENLQRADLNPIELASAYQRLVDAGWTQAQIASEVGKSRAAVANVLRLQRLPASIQHLVVSGALGEGHGRALLSAPKARQRSLARRAAEESWSVRQLEQAIREISDKSEKSSRPAPARRVAPTSAAMAAALERLEAALGTRVELRTSAKGSSGGGRIVVHWYDEEQLLDLAARISGGAPPVAAEGLDGDEFGV